MSDYDRGYRDGANYCSLPDNYTDAYYWGWQAGRLARDRNQIELRDNT